jgi:5-methylcytosine-specific restriction endonuclease McrA
MNFETPLTIHVMPKLEDFLAAHKKEKFARIVYEVNLRVYWRTVIGEAQDMKCIWCQCKMTNERNKRDSATIEHMIPRSEGGPDDPSNYTVACSNCNHKRGNMSVESFKEVMASKIAQAS